MSGCFASCWKFYQRHFGLKLIKFLLAGLPSFLVALPFNWLLVEKAQLARPLSYAIVLFFQVTVNFFVCRLWVFDADRGRSLWKQYVGFMAGIAFFRLADWGVYSLLVSVFGFYYLAVQLANIVVFSFLKFGFSKKVMESGRKER